VDASIFWLAALEFQREHGNEAPASLVSLTYGVAGALQLVLLLLTLLIPHLALEWHEYFKVRQKLCMLLHV
jgi:hypothetical protein